MASESKSNPLEQQQQHQAVHDDDAPAHHPYAPPDELFDISTAVDPSYIISLIRKLIPISVQSDHNPSGVDASDDVCGKGSTADHMEECGTGASPCRDKVSKSVENGAEKMNSVDDFDKSACQDREDEDSSLRLKKHCNLAGKDAWEEYGCVLWDLAASRTHAELMVENLILEVLLSHLMVSQSVRITEICLGIIANLACHEVPMKYIVSTNGLIEIIIEQLFLDDTQCLCEACRSLTLGLQGDKCNAWAEALQSERVLSRIMWVAENTLNPQLIEKSVGLLLAILESEQGASAVLLTSLMKLGLTSLLVSLLAFEMSTLTGQRVPERYSVLDIILRAIEALSTLDGHSQEICCNKETFQLVCDLVKVPDKVEVASSCATAAILIANILSDVPDLASEASYGKSYVFNFSIKPLIALEVTPWIRPDLTFLQGLLDIFPLVSDDLESRSALWSIIARLLVRVKESEMGLSSLHQYVLVLVSKAEVIEDDLLERQLDDHSEESRSSTSSDAKSNARKTALRRIVSILNQWIASKDCHKEGEELNDIDVNICKLLDSCCKHIECIT